MLQKRFIEADQEFDEALKVHLKYKDGSPFYYSRNTWTLVNWANIMIQMGRCDEAKYKISEAEKLLPENPDPFKGYATIDRGILRRTHATLPDEIVGAVTRSRSA